jgi:predicted RNA-binding protein with EMAP domain
MVRPDVAGVRDAPCVRSVAGHPSGDGVRVCEVDVGGCDFRAGLTGDACAVDEDIDAF